MNTLNTRPTRGLTMAEIEALLDAARASGPRDLMLVALPLDTGGQRRGDRQSPVIFHQRRVAPG